MRMNYWMYEIEVNGQIVRGLTKSAWWLKEQMKDEILANFGSDVVIRKLAKTTKRNYENGQM